MHKRKPIEYLAWLTHIVRAGKVLSWRASPSKVKQISKAYIAIGEVVAQLAVLKGGVLQPYAIACLQHMTRFVSSPNKTPLSICAYSYFFY